MAWEQLLQDGLALSDTVGPCIAPMNSIENSFLNFMNSRYFSRSQYSSNMILNMIFEHEKKTKIHDIMHEFMENLEFGCTKNLKGLHLNQYCQFTHTRAL